MTTQISLVQPEERTAPSDTTRDYGASCDASRKGPISMVIKNRKPYTFKWLISTPRYDYYNCSMAVYHPSMGWVTIQPYEPTKKQPFSDPYFLCGLGNGQVEERQFWIDGLSCEYCTLRFAFTNYGQTLYACSDVMVYDEPLEKCLGQCLNDGVCTDGRCVCLPNYEGELCQNMKYNPDAESNQVQMILKVSFVIMMIIFLILLAIFILRVYYFKNTQYSVLTE